MKKLLLIPAIFALFIACESHDIGNLTTFTVTFNSNHEDINGYKLANPEKIEVSPNKTVGSLPTAPTRANHNFVKWTVNKDGTGDDFTEETTVNADITVYAQWTDTGSTPVDPSGPNITYRNLFLEIGKSQQQIDAKVQGTFNKLLVNGAANEIIYYEAAPDMAYILDVHNNDVRSEGMSYGMMMCVQMNDKTRFDRLWKWARTYMYNDRTKKIDNVRGYFSWQCNTNGTRKDANPAPDGEMYFVTALLFASARWRDGSGIFEYGREARNILYDMIHRDSGGLDNWGAPSMFNTTHKMPVFSTIGSAANHTDPSYHLPAFYEVWAIEVEEGEEYWDIWGGEAAARTDAAFWRGAAAASRAFFPTTVNATTGLGPDYANFDGTPTGGEHQDFRYDAWRIAMNIGMDYSWWKKDSWQVTFANKIQSFFHGKGITSYGSLWNLNGNGPLQNGNDHSPGLVACNAVVSLAASHSLSADFINNFWDVPMTSGQYRYYDGCLYMLGLLHVSGKFKVYFPANRAASSSITPTTATFDKKAGAQADIAVTMTLNGNTLTSIKNGNTTLTAGNNTYTASGNTVTLKKEYLAQQANGTATLTFVFSAGRERTIAINIGDTTGGGPIGGTGTEYDFTGNPSVTLAYDRASPADLSAEVTNGTLKVTKATNYSTPKLILDFDLGSTPMGSYSQLRFVMRGVSGDLGSKTFKADVNADGTTWIAIGNVSTGSFGTTFANFNVPIGSSTVTGPIKIRFYLDNTNPFVYEIQSIKFVQ